MYCAGGAVWLGGRPRVRGAKVGPRRTRPRRRLPNPPGMDLAETSGPVRSVGGAYRRRGQSKIHEPEMCFLSNEVSYFLLATEITIYETASAYLVQ